MIKKLEHFWKGLSHNSSQISPIRPEPYGDRFVNFITGITKTKEAAEREEHHESFEQKEGSYRGYRAHSSSIDSTRFSGERFSQSSVERTLEKAQKQAHKTEMEGRSEEETPERVLATARSPSAERSGGVAGTTLPVVEEAGEAASTGGRSAHSAHSQSRNPDAEDNQCEGNTQQLPNGDSGFGSGTSESPAERKSVSNPTAAAYLPDPPKLEPRFSQSPSPVEPQKRKDQRVSSELEQRMGRTL